MSTIPSFDSGALVRLCERYGIRRLAVFGSALRGEDRPNSDLDVLVEFRPGSVPGLAFITLQNDLSALFLRPVDLVTPGFLSPHFRDRVLLEASPLYEAA
ncbi:MAG TPA: nucleotidyltransferase family protein [Thermoanaerobaculia bacterium]